LDIIIIYLNCDRLCGLVVRVPGYRSWGPGFHSRRYQIFWEVMGLERGQLKLVRITEELLEWKSSGFGLGNRNNDRRDPLCWPRDTLYPQKLALTSPTCCGRSVGILRLRSKGYGVYLNCKWVFTRCQCTTMVKERCRIWNTLITWNITIILEMQLCRSQDEDILKSTSLGSFLFFGFDGHEEFLHKEETWVYAVAQCWALRRRKRHACVLILQVIWSGTLIQCTSV
jgi:hypothetical protein